MPSNPDVTAKSIIAPVEIGQSVLIGTVPVQSFDPLTLTQTEGAGVVTLGLVINGVQDVWYTAPASVGALTADTVAYTLQDLRGQSTAVPEATIVLDPGPNDTASAPVVLESGQSAVIATVAPGLPSDTLTLVNADSSVSMGPALPDGTQLVIFTAPASVTTSVVQSVSYAIADQNGVGNIYTVDVQLDGGPVITPVPTGRVEANQTVVIGTATLGLPCDVLTVTQTAGSQGTVSPGAVH